MEPLPVRATAPLSSLSLDQSRQYGRKATMDQVGKAFETLFMQTIMKSMRDAQIEGGILDNEQAKPFQSMLDGAYSELSVKTTKLGLSEAINRQFAPKTGPKASGLASASPVNLPVNLTGGQMDALTAGLSASVAAGQTLGLKSVQGAGSPTSLTAPRMAPKFMVGD
jgi:Rod binding domain-containing protein